MLAGLMISWMILLGLVTLIWISRHWEIALARRDRPPLSSATFDGPPENPPRISVLVAAKDEEENIEACVRTLMEQDYPNFELLVINDRSTDRTGEILDRLAAEYGARANGRLRAIHVTELRDGWFGKNNAMREGVEQASGEWLCFSDADCRQTSNRTLSMAMRQALEKGIDFLSVLPVLETHGVWERIIQPVCGAIMVFWFPPRKVNDPRASAAYANGAFMLISREAYDRLGGHEPVKAEVNEDMHLARRAKRIGLHLHVMQNSDLYTTRMYTGLGQIWRGWSRIFYGCFGTYPRLITSFLVLLIISVMPYLSLAAGAVAVVLKGWSGAGLWVWVLVLAAAAVLANQVLIYRYYRLTQADPRYTPTYIIGSLIGLGMLVNSMLKVGGKTRTVWRGTAYRGQQREALDGAR
jgi:cellulose synthase/poly-beta-1,6-N-acetylglucosamine synthase-like glycosyltransferase